MKKDKQQIKISYKKGGHFNSSSNLNSYTKFFIISIWVVVGGLTGSIFVNAMSNENSQNSNITNETPQQLIESSSQAINGVSWNIDSVKTSMGSGPFSAPKGEKFIIVNLNIINDSAYTYNFAPVLQTKVISENVSYEMWPTTLENPIVAGPLESGKTVSGEISFLVPDNLTQASFEFKVFENENNQTQQINF